MNTFRSIDELVKMFDRDKNLLKEMFAKRKSNSFRYDYAVELTDGRDERIRNLLDFNVIREAGDFLELEDVYLKFFEAILGVNEEINTSYIDECLQHIKENIDYYLKEDHDGRKNKYKNEVRQNLKTIGLTTVRNVLDLKRNMDHTYKNEPNYQIKKAKLERLCEKQQNISLLIRKCEDLIEEDVFFKVAMDIDLRKVVNEVKISLNDSSHSLIEIHRQIIHFLNLIDYQNLILEKVKKLKYLKDQFIIKEYTNIEQVVSGHTPIYADPQPRYPIRLSLNNLRTSTEALDCLKKLTSKRKQQNHILQNLAAPIDDDYLEGLVETDNTLNLQTIFDRYVQTKDSLFSFVMTYPYDRPLNLGEKLSIFCQMASQFAEYLQFTDQTQCSDEIEYPLIYAKRSTHVEILRNNL